VPPSIVTTARWHSLLDGDARTALEREALLPFLARQRWFAGKARRATEARIGDWGVLSPGDEPAFLCLVHVDYADGGRDRYFVPMAASETPAASRIEGEHPANVIARLSGPRVGVLHDVLEERVAPILLDVIAEGRRIRMHAGEIQAAPTSAFAEARSHAPSAQLRVRHLLGEQSNTSLIYGDRLILKVLRRVEPGLNPDYEVGLHLTEHTGFDRAPRLVGALAYRSGAEPTIVGVMHAFVEHDVNAWEYSLDEARQFFDHVQSRPEAPSWAPSDTTSIVVASQGEAPALARETMGGYLKKAALLGRRTAELHAALADAKGDPAFEPEPLTSLECGALGEEMQSRALEVVAALRASFDRVPAGLAARARQLVEAPATFVAPFARLAGLDPVVSRIRVHGDYHLGQVLRVRDDFVIIDFEGEPLRSIEERRRKHPAVKDVAGMLRSFSYAAYAGLFRYVGGRPDELAPLEPWAQLWHNWASAAFLRAYLRTAGSAPFVPRDLAALDVLLRAFLLDKAFYELAYELSARPDWLRIPLPGILSLAGAP
jgi:maltose alpha-D-glucosyltransferase/alpha-amylase